MSVEHLAAVLHHSRATGTVKVVLLGIANHAGDGGSWPTVATLARYANVDVRTVQRALARLEELGDVRRHVQAGGDHRTRHHSERPNLYEVLLECPEGCAGGPNHRPRNGWERLEDGTYRPVDNPPPDRVTPTSPGDTDVTPPPDTGVTQTTHSTDATRSPALPQGHARGLGASVAEATVTAADAGVLALDSRPCHFCGARNELTCLRRQLKLAAEDRHAYDNGRSPDVGDEADTVVERRNEDEGVDDGR